MAGSVPAAALAREEIAWRWITLSPALLLLLAFSVLPILNLLAVSFLNVQWSGGRPAFSGAGLSHYRSLGSDELFRAGVANTLVFAVFAVAGQMLLGFALALLTSRTTRGRIVYRTIFILPILIPGIVIGAIWKLMFQPDFGLINQIFALAGLGPFEWLKSASTALMSVIIVDIWHWTPFCFLLFLAGLESLPQDVYEAAEIDGASFWQELRHVTLPLMMPAILVTLVFRIVVAFKVFDEVFLLTSGGPGTSTEVVSFTIYQRFFTEDRAGYGSAMSIAVIFIVSLLLAAALSARKRIGPA